MDRKTLLKGSMTVWASNILGFVWPSSAIEFVSRFLKLCVPLVIHSASFVWFGPMRRGGGKVNRSDSINQKRNRVA